MFIEVTYMREIYSTKKEMGYDKVRNLININNIIRIEEYSGEYKGETVIFMDKGHSYRCDQSYEEVKALIEASMA